MAGGMVLWNTVYPRGGVTSFSVALSEVLGWPLVRISKRSATRSLGVWKKTYFAQTIEDIVQSSVPLILAGGSNSIPDGVWRRLAERKAPTFWVFHDPTEFKTMPHVTYMRPDRCIVLRESNLAHQPNAVVLPQPYLELFQDGIPDQFARMRAICTARIDGMKRTTMIVEANRMIQNRNHKITLFGAHNRLYVYSKKTKYPELLDSRPFPAAPQGGAFLAAQAIYSVDMTKIDGDGGGMQYTTLEAMDGGAIPVLSTEWLSHAGRASDIEALGAASAVELAQVIQEPITSSRKKKLQKMARYNKTYLRQYHGADFVRHIYKKELKLN